MGTDWELKSLIHFSSTSSQNEDVKKLFAQIMAYDKGPVKLIQQVKIFTCNV